MMRGNRQDSIDDIDKMIDDVQASGGRARTGAFQFDAIDSVTKFTQQSGLAGLLQGMNLEGGDENEGKEEGSQDLDDLLNEMEDPEFEGRTRSAASAINLNSMGGFGLSIEKPITNKDERKLDDVDKQILEFMAARMTIIKDLPTVVGSNENLNESGTRDTIGIFSTPQTGARGRATQAFLSPHPKSSMAHQRLSVMDASKGISAWSGRFDGGTMKPLEPPPPTPEELKLEEDRKETWIDLVEKKLRENPDDKTPLKYKINKEAVMQRAYKRTRGSIPQDVKKEVNMIASILQKKAKESKSSRPMQVADKQLIDIFDEKERATIKAIKQDKPNCYESIFEKDIWKPNGLPPVLLGKAQKIFDLVKDQHSGKLTSFAISQDCKSLYVVGTDTGEVIEVDIAKRTCKKDKLGKKVNSLDISDDNQLWVAVLESGEVYVKKTFGSWLSKRQFMENSPLRYVRFIDNENLIAATDTHVLRFVVKNLKVMFDITKHYIIQNSPSVIVNVSVVPIGALSNLVVSTAQSVTMYLLSNPIEQLYCVERPDYISPDTLPSVTWLFPEEKPFQYLLICWDDYAYLYKIEGPTCLVCGMKKLAQRISWCCVLRNRMILIIMEDCTVMLETVQSLFANVEYRGGFDKTFKLPERNLSRFKMMKASSGSVAKTWSESIKSYKNTLFFLRDDSITNVYLMGFDELANVYKDRDEWILSLKLCLDIILGRIKSNENELETIKVELQTLILAYLEKKAPRATSLDEIQSRALRNCIDAAIVSENQEFLFTTLRQRFEGLNFWREIELFIEQGVISRLSLDLLTDSAPFLSANLVQYLVYKVPDKELSGESGVICNLVGILKKRKMWQSLYRIALVHYNSQLSGILTSILTDLMCYDDSANSMLKDCATDSDDIQALSTSPTIMCYMRMFWFLKVIVNWNVGLILKNFSFMEEIWIKAVEWLMDPSSIKVLMSVNSNMYLEIYFDLFLNVDFNNSQVIGHTLKQRLTMIKNAIEGISTEAQLKDPEDQELQTTEEDTREDEEEEIDNFITFKAIVESLLQFSDETKKVEISFLSLKLISLSVFKQILDDSDFVKNLLFNILSEPYSDKRLWFNYEPISKQDFEEKVVRIVDQFQKSKAFDRDCKRQLADLATRNDFYRISAFMIEITRGSIDAYRQYFASLKGKSPGHFFMWLKKKITETRNLDKKIELCFEVVNDLEDLVDFILT